MEPIKINIQIKAEDIFNFLISHNYSKISGLITGIFGLVCLILLPFSFFWDKILVTVVLFFGAFSYLLLTPLSFYSNSKRQMLSNPIFKHKITYTFSDKGMDVSQYVNSSSLSWDDIIMVSENKKSLLFYINNEQAFILPKRMIESAEELEELKKLITDNAELTKVKLKK